MTFGEKEGLTYRGKKSSSSQQAQEEDELPSFTWQEVAEHCTAESLWVAIHGKVYDITSFLDKHPGGYDALLIAAGRDATAAFDSYHPFTSKPQQMIGKYEIGRLSTYEFPPYQEDTGFYRELSQRVGEYFAKNKIDYRSPFPGMWRMAIVWVVGAITFYYAFSHTFESFYLRAVLAFLFGIFQALPLLHTMHDCSHMAFGPNETWWRVGGRLAMDFMAGANMTSWHNQHTVGHHIYTNVVCADPDLPANLEGDIRFLVNRQVWTWVHKLQHLYLPPLYGLLTIKFRFQDIFETFGGGHNGPLRVNPIPAFWWGEMILTKVFWLGWRLLMPILLWNYDVFSRSSMLELFTLFFLVELGTGYYLAFNFQVSHVSTVAEYPLGTKNEDVVPEEWAISQVKTSVDYAHGDMVTTFLAGALNYQIAHHLFPGISQYQYPAIAPIIKEVCDEYGVKYTVLPSFMDAFHAHLQYLYEMGQQGKAVSVEMG
jgi:fatty acid desaturase/predicted heme/steroid binding protein